MTELNETVGKQSGQAQRKKERTQTAHINENSTPDEVSLWVIELLNGQDGANLFCLNKANLIQACGREEGSRLYSQLLVQKNQSNYRTHSSAELKAILNYRRKHIDDLTNEVAANDQTENNAN
ncbi:hypothetical protein DICVIV_02813 [Dictyocaulus viviparus]|uniref:SAM domain-containing protein n=1 Tax=Dictyocaulus viviparus TaxID=29172 RepID=A0A0D8Y4C9_DICVI|nr:hypothetical protein DICVIV_02813 [Dictyocaulus viviparus]